MVALLTNFAYQDHDLDHDYDSDFEYDQLSYRERTMTAVTSLPKLVVLTIMAVTMLISTIHICKSSCVSVAGGGATFCI